MRPIFTTGIGAGEGQRHRHLQEDAEEVADVVGLVLGEALGAIPALEEEALARCDFRKALLELPRLTCKNQRRIRRDPLLERGERIEVGIIGDLLDRFRAPAVGGPALLHRTLLN